MAALAPSASVKKRKKIVLSIEDKLDILKLIECETSYTVISEKYGIGRSTVGDIKKQKSKLESFKRRLQDMGMKKIESKTMKIGEYKLLEEALYIYGLGSREN